MEPTSSLQSTWDFLYKIIEKNSIAWLLNCYEIPIQGHMLTLLKTLHICRLFSHWALSNCCDPLWDTFYISMIKITYTSPLDAMLPHWKIALYPSTHIIELHAMTWPLSPKLPSYRIWATQKEIKRHARRHVRKKERKIKREKKNWAHEGPRKKKKNKR